MKKIFSKTTPNSYILFATVFLAAALSLPANFLGINPADLSVEITPQSVATVITAAIFSAVCAAGLQKLISAASGLLIPFAVMIFADPLLGCSFLNYPHLLLLTACIGIILFLTVSDSFIQKLIVSGVFAFVSALIYAPSAFSFVPIVCLAFAAEHTAQKNGAAPTSRKKSKQKKQFDLKLLSPLAIFAAAVAAAAISPKTAPLFVPISSITYQAISVDAFWSGARILFAAIPYIIVLVLFFKNYFSIKNSEKKAGTAAILKTPALWLAVTAFSVILFGANAFGHAASVTVFNLAAMLVIVLFCRYDKENALQAIQRLCDAFAGKKLILFAVFSVWFVLMQIVFKSVQHTLLDQIFSTTGSLL